MDKMQKSTQLAAAEDLEEAAKRFAAETREIPVPSETSALLLSLAAVQSTLDGVYTELARWHRGVVLGVHHAGEDERGDPENPGWMRADVALREAAQYGAQAADALGRAHSGNEVALWFDEIRDDGAR